MARCQPSQRSMAAPTLSCPLSLQPGEAGRGDAARVGGAAEVGEGDVVEGDAVALVRLMGEVFLLARCVGAVEAGGERAVMDLLDRLVHPRFERPDIRECINP